MIDVNNLGPILKHTIYSGDLNTGHLINGSLWIIVLLLVCYSSHDLNIEQKVSYSSHELKTGLKVCYSSNDLNSRLKVGDSGHGLNNAL